jgi:hypothetical protein
LAWPSDGWSAASEECELIPLLISKYSGAPASRGEKPQDSRGSAGRTTRCAERHQVLEVALLVIIATGRHIVLLDAHHTAPLTYVGLGVLMLGLTGSYFLMKRSSAAH